MLRWLAAVSLILTMAACGQGGTIEFSNPVKGKCPVMGGDIDPALTYTYEGRTYAFCCEMCIPKFKANPDKYLKHSNTHEGHDH